MSSDTFFEFLAFLVQGIFWWFVIQLVLAVFLRMQENKEQKFNNMIKKLDEITHRVTVEKHGEMYYWFDSDDNEFLAQGKGFEDTVDQLKKRFPNHIFFVTTGDKQYKIASPSWNLEPY
jgi:aspartate/methionine/tyrosine aminotransferase